jgi:hypothetical protein
LVLGGLQTQDGNVVNLFNGILDDIRIYSRCLTAEEIKEMGPLPEIIFDKQPVGYRVAQGRSVTLSMNASVRGTQAPISLQWELNGNVIAGATNNTLSVIGAMEFLGKYRVLVTAGDLQAYSDEVEVVTVAPAEARLLLHLEFEENPNGTFIDSAGHFPGIVGNVALAPGRVGTFGAELSGTGYVRVPAAGTELELVGSSYTIAWWMQPRVQNTAQQIFTLGTPLAGITGYGARIDGPTSNRSLRTEHRDGQSQLLTLPIRISSNWVHLAIVYNGLNRTIYINGSPTNSTVTAATLLGSGRDDLLLGAEATNRLSNVGLIDDFRIYNYALASGEVADLASVPLPAPRILVSLLGETITLRWAKSDPAQYRVESTPSLEANVSWTPLSSPVQSAGSYNFVKQTSEPGARYYRLRQL